MEIQISQTSNLQERSIWPSILSSGVDPKEERNDASVLFLQYNELSNAIVNIKCQIQELRNKRTFPVQNLRSNKLQLKEPLYLSIEFEDDTFVVFSDDLNLYGHGETELNAIRDFCKEVENLFFALKESKNKLGKVTQEIWGFAQEIIKEK